MRNGSRGLGAMVPCGNGNLSVRFKAATDEEKPFRAKHDVKATNSFAASAPWAGRGAQRLAKLNGAL